MDSVKAPSPLLLHLFTLKSVGLFLAGGWGADVFTSALQLWLEKLWSMFGSFRE